MDYNVSIPLSRGSLCNQARIRCTAAPSGVSIPLSRGSLCNTIWTMMISLKSTRFNPSVEGKSLQQFHNPCRRTEEVTFQSLCRGEVSATYIVHLLVYVDKFCFNPSVEGKSLQQPCEIVSADDLSVSIPLSRGSLCNRAVVEALITNGYKRQFF